MARFGQATSEHPLASHAAGEVAGSVLEQVGDGSSLAVVFVSGAHVEHLADIAFTVRSVLSPDVLVGAAVGSLVGGPREIEQRAAISLWAGAGFSAELVRLRAVRDGAGIGLVGWPGDPASATAMLLLADPWSFPTEGFLAHLAESSPDLAVTGGLVASDGPDRCHLVVDTTTVSDGAVGVLLDGVGLSTVVSQGCRPVGEPYVVTESDGPMIQTLAGQAPVERIRTLIESAAPEERELLTSGLHLGVVVDEHLDRFGAGDFLIRNVRGIDAATGAIATDDAVEVGTTVQFQVRDALGADEDLRRCLVGRSAGAALLFTCNGRGRHLFGTSDHDATLVHEALGGAPLAGMFCAGEIGPVAGQSHLHGFTASVLLFDA